MILEDIDKQVVKLMEHNVDPKFIIMGRASYLSVRVETQRMLDAFHAAKSSLTLELEASIDYVNEIPSSSEPAGIMSRRGVLTIVVDPSLEHYVRVVPAPYRAALM